MTEFANFLTNGMPGGYSSLGGYGFNPYDPRPLPGGDGRPVLSPSGSSSGSGHRRGGQPRGGRHRHRDIRLDSRPGRRQRHRRHQADRGPGQPRRHHPDHRRSGHRRTAGAHGARRRDRARRDRRVRSSRPGDRRLPGTRQVLQRLHPVSRPRCAAGARIAVPPFDELADRRTTRSRVLRSKGATVDVIPALAGIGAGHSELRLQARPERLSGQPAAVGPRHSLAEIIAGNLATPGR